MRDEGSGSGIYADAQCSFIRIKILTISQDKYSDESKTKMRTRKSSCVTTRGVPPMPPPDVMQVVGGDYPLLVPGLSIRCHASMVYTLSGPMSGGGAGLSPVYKKFKKKMYISKGLFQISRIAELYISFILLCMKCHTSVPYLPIVFLHIEVERLKGWMISILRILFSE